ncbi:MAG: hypothetical protein LBF86_06425, partial [Helicobacteraceae bacterium]|nr:hypothetical protein [Helicobacteraceae bacterium]
YSRDKRLHGGSLFFGKIRRLKNPCLAPPPPPPLFAVASQGERRAAIAQPISTPTFQLARSQRSRPRASRSSNRRKEFQSVTGFIGAKTPDGAPTSLRNAIDSVKGGL